MLKENGDRPDHEDEWKTGDSVKYLLVGVNCRSEDENLVNETKSDANLDDMTCQLDHLLIEIQNENCNVYLYC